MNHRNVAAFYQWGEAVLSGFDDVDVEAGDEVSFTILTTSNTTGIFTATKTSTLQSQVVQVSAPNSPLCLSNAGWFVDGPTSVIIANFTGVTFKAPLALLKGELLGPESSGGFTADIERNTGSIFTETVVTNLEDITVKYVH